MELQKSPQKHGPKKRPFNVSEPLSRVWFMARGYKQADTCHTGGQIVWLHPKTNDVLSQYGTKLTLNVVPKERHKRNTTQYLELPCWAGNMMLARLKYLTFVGPIPEGYTIDHIDGNTFNNDIRNLRAIPDAINRRDGGFQRKLRNNGVIIANYPGIILEGFERMAQWKACHTTYAYLKLKGDALKQLFLGPAFRIDPDILDKEPTKYADYNEQ